MAFTITLNFDYEINTSLQVGDQVYHTSTGSMGGFDHQGSIGAITHIGSVWEIISPFQIIVQSEYDDASGIVFPGIIPLDGNYISFSKNRIVNNNDLLGYYAEVTLLNDSPHKAELFSIGSVITENSK